ncbi:MAG TPA: TonB-dependent receptor [Nitrospirae bacterium]|nr:TonB-dependent receptor [Nitrospirota bacterium]
MRFQTKRLLIWISILVLIFSETTFASETRLSEIIVSSARFAVPLKELSQQVEVIESDEIKDYGANSIDEALRYLSTIDVMQRGPFGIQSDISIRGGSFEQTLFLINGIRVNDPQTGHFHSDIPIGINEIERIEIMPGASSAVYGHGSFGGIINIITKDKSDSIISGGVKLGDNSYQRKNIAFTLPIPVNVRFGFEGQKSDGYKINTDFDNKIFNAFLNSNHLNLITGFSEKKFGANSFYTAKYPMQWEHTKSFLLAGKGDFKIEAVKISPTFIYRHHYDYYVLIRDNPSFYNNTHKTNYLSMSVPLYIDTNYGKFITGFELSYDNIDSTRLGNNKRSHQALFGGIKKYLDKSIINLDLRLDHYDRGVDFELSPSFSALYKLTKDIKARMAINKSFRLPSYTELYYTSPVHKSNPNLKPEKVWQIESGMDFYGENFMTSFTLFQKWGSNIIDWLKMGDYWISDNINKVDTTGLTSAVIFFYKSNSIKFDYSWLNQRNNATLQSGYLNYLRHKVNLTINSQLPFDIKGTILISHLKRIYQDSYTLLDLKITKPVKYNKIKGNLFIEGKNLTDKTYYDINSVIMPGRWLFAGVEIKI